MRIGQGYDVHKLVEGRDLILGGVTIPYEKGRKGSALEEERRLFYVGLTRTKDRLFLSFTENRYEKPLKPSRFLMEMGLDERLFFKENRRKF